MSENIISNGLWGAKQLILPDMNVLKLTLSKMVYRKLIPSMLVIMKQSYSMGT